jgi:hypothetical protein
MLKINIKTESCTRVQYGKGIVNIRELYDKLRDHQLSKKKYIFLDGQIVSYGDGKCVSILV